MVLFHWCTKIDHRYIWDANLMITGSLDTASNPLARPLNRIVAEVVQSVERWLHAPSASRRSTASRCSAW
jgi:hypothetical protein